MATYILPVVTVVAVVTSSITAVSSMPVSINTSSTMAASVAAILPTKSLDEPDFMADAGKETDDEDDTENADLASSNLRHSTVTARRSIDVSAIAFSTKWIRFGRKEYLFVMDASRISDLGRDEANAACRDLAGGLAATAAGNGGGATADNTPTGTGNSGLLGGLVALETEDELDFVRQEIRSLVIAAGQEFAHEQWWTAGISSAGRWIWDIAGHPPVKVSALKRTDVPKRKKGSSLLPPLVSYLALSYGPDQQGWRLRVVPGTFRLRYVCQRVPSFAKFGSTFYDERHWSLHDYLYNNARRMRTETDVVGGPVSLAFALLRNIEMDEHQQTACITGIVTSNWTDSRLKWDKLLHNNTSFVNLAASRLWTPEALIFDPVTGIATEFDALRDGQARVTSEGHVTARSMPEMCDMRCSTDRRMLFPFDRHSTKRLSTCQPLSSVTDWIDAISTISSRNQANNLSLYASFTSKAADTCGFRLEFEIRRLSTFYHVVILVVPLLISSVLAVGLQAAICIDNRRQSRHCRSAKTGSGRKAMVNLEVASGGHEVHPSDYVVTECGRCSRHRCSGGRSISTSAHLPSLMSMTLVLAFLLQYTCQMATGIERAVSIWHLPLIVIYILLLMSLLMTSACVRMIKSSVGHRTSDGTMTTSCCHGYKNAPTSNSCAKCHDHDGCRKEINNKCQQTASVDSHSTTTVTVKNTARLERLRQSVSFSDLRQADSLRRRLQCADGQGYRLNDIPRIAGNSDFLLPPPPQPPSELASRRSIPSGNSCGRGPGRGGADKLHVYTLDRSFRDELVQNVHKDSGSIGWSSSSGFEKPPLRHDVRLHGASNFRRRDTVVDGPADTAKSVSSLTHQNQHDGLTEISSSLTPSSTCLRHHKRIPALHGPSADLSCYRFYCCQFSTDAVDFLIFLLVLGIIFALIVGVLICIIGNV